MQYLVSTKCIQWDAFAGWGWRSLSPLTSVLRFENLNIDESGLGEELIRTNDAIVVSGRQAVRGPDLAVR